MPALRIINIAGYIIIIIIIILFLALGTYTPEGKK